MILKMPGWTSFLMLLLKMGVNADELTLGASPLATYVDTDGEPAKLNAIVTEALKRMKQPASLKVLRRAFLGSDLSAGRLNGEYAFIDLDKRSANMVYSAQYLPLKLFAVSKSTDVKTVSQIPQLKNSRIAVENRFASNATVRAISQVKWSRTPSTYDAFRQFADDRSPMLLTSALLVDEFNRLLKADNEEGVFRSAAPLFSSGFFVSIKKNTNNAEKILSDFNLAIGEMQKDGTYNVLLGLPWLIKDINGDGIGDFITSTQVSHTEIQNIQALTGYSLDGIETGEASVFVVDGKVAENWDEAAAWLSSSPRGERVSFLDAEVYDTILRRW